MSQDTMLILDEVDNTLAAERAAARAAREREFEEVWSHKTKCLGTATRESILRNAKPDMQWDDYAI